MNIKNIELYLQTIDNAYSSNDIRKLFQIWLKKTLKNVTEKCKLLLSNFTSASDVAYIQHKVWETSTILNPHAISYVATSNRIESDNKSIMELLYTQ